MRALVADDSKMMSEYLSAILQRLGFDAIDVAKDGREAVRFLAAQLFFCKFHQAACFGGGKITLSG